jgi:hypothetical protein
MSDSWPKGLPADFALIEITDQYPLEDMVADKGLWSRFKRALGKSKPAAPTRTRREWFTVYEEPNKGFIIFEDRDIRRILMMETTADAGDLAGCRIVLQLFNDIHLAMRDLKEKDAVEFHQRFLHEVKKMCSIEPQSRKPDVFLQDTFSADARLNGLFYQPLCVIYSEICRIWRSKDPQVKYELTKAQDRVIELWKKRPHGPAWKEAIEEAGRLLARAREWAANPPSRPKRKVMRDAGDINSIGGLPGGDESEPDAEQAPRVEF